MLLLSLILVGTLFFQTTDTSLQHLENRQKQELISQSNDSLVINASSSARSEKIFFISKQIKSLKRKKVSSQDSNYEYSKVVRVIDGDTIVLENGKVVRYIGIDSPEMTRGKNECFSHEAKQANENLVLGKQVKMQKDVSEADKYGRLLRYVWVDDVFVNEYLVKQGFAKAVTYPPDVKYSELFRRSEDFARKQNKGLWNQNTCEVQENQNSNNVVTYENQKNTNIQPKSTNSLNNTNATNIKKYVCDCSKSCSKMSSCEEAYFQLNQCGCKARDGDGDGIPCEKICN